MSPSDALYCSECGARLTLYVVGICDQCRYDLTGEDDSLEPSATDATRAPGGSVSDPKGME